MKNTYLTKVSAFYVDENQPPFLSIEVPAAMLEDLDLKENEVIKWEIDTETLTAVLTKENIIINTKE